MTPGRKTTEFLALLFYGGLIVANGTDYINVPWNEMGGYGMLVGAYVLGRSYVKGRAIVGNGK